MITQLKRHEIQILLKAGHTQAETAHIAKVSARSVKRVAAEPKIQQVDDGAERARRRIGRPSAAEPGRYTWWSLASRARERNIGWRIEW